MLDVNMIIANNIQVDLEKENKKQVDLEWCESNQRD